MSVSPDASLDPESMGSPDAHPASATMDPMARAPMTAIRPLFAVVMIVSFSGGGFSEGDAKLLRRGEPGESLVGVVNATGQICGAVPAGERIDAVDQKGGRAGEGNSRGILRFCQEPVFD